MRAAAPRFLAVAGLILALLSRVPAQTPSPASAARAQQDSIRTTQPGPPGPSARDTSSASKSRADTVIVVKHQFNHREQIITGSIIMTCLALMMVTMNNYNPR